MPGALDASATKYLVHERLGAGGMGEVFHGTVVTPAGERPVAIKKLRTRETDAIAQERMAAEARLVFQLTHANICQVLDLAVGEQGTFIVMEFVDGCDLKTLARRGPVDAALAIYIAREVAKGLDYAHRRRDAAGRALWLIHGDVTPQNILISREGEVKLADFGIARAFGVVGPGNELVAGTPGYIAPEVLAHDRDQRSDIYSLGVTLYVALTGEPPGQRFDRGRIERDAAIAPELAAILMRATDPRKEARYATAAELEKALSLHLGRRHPEFSSSLLAERVTACAAQEPNAVASQAVSLTSLTGTATFLSPAPVEPTPEVARAGTERVVPSERGAFAPTRRRALAITGAALVLATSGWFVLSRRALEPSPIPNTAPIVPIAPKPAAAIASPSPEARPAPIAPVSAAPKKRIVRAATPPSVGTEMGYLTVDSEPWGIVFVDGRKFAEQTPLYRAPIAVGPHRVTIFHPESKTQSSPRAVTVKRGENHVLGFK